MAEYIDRTQIPYAKITCFDKGSLTTREMVESVSIADVIERAEVLDQIKEIRESMEGFSNSFKSIDNYQLVRVVGYCISLIDKLIVEVEEQDGRVQR